jgi:Tfp pilus assembly protein PilF
VRNYYVELELDPSQSATSISEQLVSLRQKWVQRSNMAATLDGRTDAQLKVSLILEAKRVFSDEESKRQYDVELNNQPEEVAKGSETTDEVYEKKLARVNEYFDEKDYKTAADRAKDMLAEGYNKADVYENVMLSLYNLGSQYDDQVQKFGDDAIDVHGIDDSRVYRVYVLATERKSNFSQAHRRLVELKRIRPNDTSVDHMIANMFMNHFGGQFLAEARDYIDVLIRNKQCDSDSNVAEWDVRCELRQHRLQMAIPKIAKYLTADPADSHLTEDQHLTAGRHSDSPFRREALPHFTKLLEDYIASSYSNVASYLLKLDSTLVGDNIVCGKSIPAWDMAYTLERSNDLTADWYRLVEKYDGQKLSRACYDVMKRHAARCVRALPTYGAAVSAGASTLSTSNNADYPAVSKQLETLNTVRKQAYVSDGSVDDMIAEADGTYCYEQHQSRLKPLKRIRIFLRAYWCVFLAPLFALLLMILFSRTRDDPIEFDINDNAVDFYFIALVIILLCSSYAPLRRTKYGALIWGTVFLIFCGLLPLSILSVMYGSESSINLEFIGKLFDSCYSIVSVQPIVSGIIALAVFIIGCVIGSKIKKATQSMDAIQFGSTLMSWIR